MQRQYDNGQNYKHQYRKHHYAYPMAFTLSNYYCLFLHIFYLLISIRQIQVFRIPCAERKLATGRAVSARLSNLHDLKSRIVSGDSPPNSSLSNSIRRAETSDWSGGFSSPDKSARSKVTNCQRRLAVKFLFIELIIAQIRV